ncbi:hypothetical protein AKJ53_01325 [candidate division MSBL1 archaeon SCGC-AAA382F02]|uniref:Ion-translocating oxidoreductase complex subunit C n=1 Tax=candidate division MSBL1 archaeon SCGC-AAA382F02 TaxID=1698282 RepID=A0A133VI36_9EURY|nr:hypothetical protein AKJ53_01325 [candidate division MSBL1 archaeon SCGC-AAA382F02]
MIKAKDFEGGVHPEYKKLTAKKEIEKAELPKKVIFPLRQYVGKIYEPLVDEGDHLKVGQKIGDSDYAISAPIHASVSGEVSELTTHPSPLGGEVKSIVIESDEKDEWVETKGINPKKAAKEEIIAKIRECGLVGLGGAGFPTHTKLSPPKGKTVDTVIINGAECEPYLTSDHRLMLEEGEKIIKGAKIIEKILKPERTLIAIENNKPDAIKNLKNLSDENIEIVPLETKYPQGDERHIIKAVLDREVPSGGLPFDVGVGVQNVGTTKAIHDAVYEGTPLIERVISVTGDVQNRKNLLARIGTPFSNLINQCGGGKGKTRQVIFGGPMMGTAQTKDAPIMRGTTGIVVFNEKRVEKGEELPCIKCGRCIEACPMNLMPTKLKDLVENEMWETAQEDYNLLSCDRCGCCAYVCPSKIPLVETIRDGQCDFRERGG